MHRRTFIVYLGYILMLSWKQWRAKRKLRKIYKAQHTQLSFNEWLDLATMIAGITRRLDE